MVQPGGDDRPQGTEGVEARADQQAAGLHFRELDWPLAHIVGAGETQDV